MLKHRFIKSQLSRVPNDREVHIKGWIGRYDTYLDGDADLWTEFKGSVEDAVDWMQDWLEKRLQWTAVNEETIKLLKTYNPNWGVGKQLNPNGG